MIKYKLKITGDIFVEIWRVVQEYPEYEISNKNGWRLAKNKKNFYGSLCHGYRYISIGRKHKEFYHRLVAKAFPEFCGEWFEGCEVHHKDYNRLNNAPENLIILSSEEHSRLHYDKTLPDTFKKCSEKRKESISKALKGKYLGGNCLNKTNQYVDMLEQNGNFVKKFDSIASAARYINGSAGNICECCKGKLKQAYGFLWRYACK